MKCCYFQITGIILLSIGVAIHGVYHNYQHFLDNKFLSVPSLLIAIGTIIFFIAFFGCCGAIRENHFMIITVIYNLVILITPMKNEILFYIEKGVIYGKSKIKSKLWNKISYDASFSI